MGAVSDASMASQFKNVAGPGRAELPAVSFSNTSAPSAPTPSSNNRGCQNGAFMASFGIFLQGLLAVVAFSTLMCKYELRHSCRVCEISNNPPHHPLVNHIDNDFSRKVRIQFYNRVRKETFSTGIFLQISSSHF